MARGKRVKRVRWDAAWERRSVDGGEAARGRVARRSENETRPSADGLPPVNQRSSAVASRSDPCLVARGPRTASVLGLRSSGLRGEQGQTYTFHNRTLRLAGLRGYALGGLPGTPYLIPPHRRAPCWPVESWSRRSRRPCLRKGDFPAAGQAFTNGNGSSYAMKIPFTFRSS
jgi:hypothetical protein